MGGHEVVKILRVFYILMHNYYLFPFVYQVDTEDGKNK